MARLFASLYFFIAAALIGTTALLDALFFSPTDSPSQSVEAARILLQHTTPNDDTVSALRQAGLEARLINRNLIAWPQVSADALANGNVATLFDDNTTLLYRRFDDTRLLEVTLLDGLNAPSTWDNVWLYSISFFLLLGIWIALWLWPLWRDLRTIHTTVANMQPNGTIVPICLPQHSRLTGIAEALNRLNERVSELLSRHKEMTGAVAHETRTPLARLKFALAAGPRDDPAHWQAMGNDVQELEHLVQEMLDYLRTDSTVPELNISELPLQALCEQTLQRLQVRNTRHIDVTVNAGAVKILGDGDYVERAVENLLVNAFRFAHSRIVIDAEIYRQKIRLSVHDDGPGISQENLQKVFAPFFRPDADRSRERGGAGLGLAIVKRIQHWHQGNCYVERSTLGGARFVLEYPYAKRLSRSQ
ncbi:ATP-binding protein [Salinimonas lutimaris]|uniref:ATP-binding protein n=1 Tax=Salinimonas lutimaris TaxID=914153 RepID=UPI0010C04E5A|nr:ATP-binding protein [Salinimonas lutimaris]